MKTIIYSFFIFYSLSLTVNESKAQKVIVPDWRQNIKISLNSINKSNSLLVDTDGNTYVLGTTWVADSAKNIVLIKFNSKGEELWERIFDNPSHGDDIPTNMCLDNNGNVWVCGMAKTSVDNADFLVVKFSPDGIPVADRLYDGKNHLFDCATSIAATRQGDIYAAGYETTLDSGINMLVIKFRYDGSIVWKRSFATRQMDVANNILTDDSSNVYVCGTSNNGPHTSDIIVQKYDSEGRKKWQLIYDGVLSQNDAGQFISADDSMNIYISGFMNHVNNRSDIPLLKLNRNGVLLQEIFYNGHIADCGAFSISAKKNSVYLIGECNDYNISVISSFFLGFDKAGKERKTIPAPEDVQLMKCFDIDGVPFLFGAKTTHPESTLIPFISECDSASLVWSFADSTIYGLAHITNIQVVGDEIYFLGDDTGDATGTISIFKYVLKEEDKIKKIKKPVNKKK